MNTILFKNATLVDARFKKARPGFEVLVENKIIQEVKQGTIDRAHEQVIDLQGKTLMPGLIDAHTHVTGPEMSPANDNIPITEIAIQAGKYLENMLARGFTSIREAGGADMGLSNAITKGLVNGPRLFYSGKALTQRGGGGDFRKINDHAEPCTCIHSAITLSNIADGVDEVRKAAREELRKGATQIKIFASGGVVFTSPTGKIPLFCYSEDEIKAIVEEAAGWGTYVMAHAYTLDAIARCVECGVRTIEHGNFLDDKTAKLMASKKVFLVPTLITLLAMSELGKADKGTFAKLDRKMIDDTIASGQHAIQIARSHGVKVGFGTDLWGVKGHEWQLKEFSLRAKVDTPFDSIYSATIVNAEILNLPDKLGIIEPNAYADLIVVDGNPLEDINCLVEYEEHLKLVMKDGIIYKNLLF